MRTSNRSGDLRPAFAKMWYNILHPSCVTENSTINSTEERRKMNYKYNCLNPIADCGLANLGENYTRTEKFDEADAVFVRSAKMDELVPGAKLLAVARAGAGVNNIPHAE